MAKHRPRSHRHQTDRQHKAPSCGLGRGRPGADQRNATSGQLCSWRMRQRSATLRPWMVRSIANSASMHVTASRAIGGDGRRGLAAPSGAGNVGKVEEAAPGMRPAERGGDRSGLARWRVKPVVAAIGVHCNAGSRSLRHRAFRDIPTTIQMECRMPKLTYEFNYFDFGQSHSTVCNVSDSTTGHLLRRVDKIYEMNTIQRHQNSIVLEVNQIFLRQSMLLTTYLKNNFYALIGRIIQ